MKETYKLFVADSGDDTGDSGSGGGTLNYICQLKFPPEMRDKSTRKLAYQGANQRFVPICNFISGSLVRFQDRASHLELRNSIKLMCPGYEPRSRLLAPMKPLTLTLHFLLVQFVSIITILRLVFIYFYYFLLLFSPNTLVF